MPEKTTEDHAEILQGSPGPLAGVLERLLTAMDTIEAFTRRVDPGGLATVLGESQALALNRRIQEFGETWAGAFGDALTRHR